MGLKRLFPTLDEQFLTPKFTERFKKRAEAMGGGWHWPNFGYIYRDPNERFLGPAYWKIMPNLPSEIQFMTVGLLQLLPSLIIVSIDVHLNEEAVSKVKKLQDTKYLPTVLFANLLPWKLWRGYTGNFPEIEMRKAILGWFDELRGRIEKALRPFLKGEFSTGSKERARLPAVEVFAVKDASEPQRDLNALAKDHHRWLDSMGIRLHFYSYSNDRLVVVFPVGDDHFGRPQYRLLVMWKSFLDSLSDGSDQDATVRHRTARFLDELTPRVALAHFTSKVSGNIGRLRKVYLWKHAP